MRGKGEVEERGEKMRKLRRREKMFKGTIRSAPITIILKSLLLTD